MVMRIPPVRIDIILESNPLKSTMLVGGLAVRAGKAADLGRSRQKLAEENLQMGGFELGWGDLFGGGLSLHIKSRKVPKP